MTAARILAGVALSLIAFFFAMLAMVHVVEAIAQWAASLAPLFGGST